MIFSDQNMTGKLNKTEQNKKTWLEKAAHWETVMYQLSEKLYSNFRTTQ